MIEIALWICFFIGLLVGAHTLLLWMEAKGWLYYRKVKRQGSGGSSILEIGAIFDPASRAAVEAREERAGEEDEDDGSDEGKRKSADRVA